MKDFFYAFHASGTGSANGGLYVRNGSESDGVSLDSEILTVGHKVKVIKGELSGIEGEVAIEANKTYVVIRIKDLLTASIKVPKSYLKIIKR